MTKNITLLILSFMLISSITFSQTWNYVNSTGTTFILYGMSFPPAQSNIGYACGMQYTYNADGVIIKTTDGGDNWTQIWPASGDIDGLQGIWFINDNLGFAGGWNNYFIKTTDGGASWTNVSCGTNVWYYTDVVFWDSNNGVASAYMNSADQCVFITSDGGNTWTQATSGIQANLMGICYADQNTLFGVSTNANVYKSTDGGHNWTVASNLGALLFGVEFADANFGVVGGEEKIFTTNDGGTTWTTFTTGYENFYACKAYSDGTAYVGGTDENIYGTTDFGATWSMEHNGSGTSHLYRIRETADGSLFACGSQGTIISREPILSADFEADVTSVCEGSTVNFTDLSSGVITSWDWSFEGGTPSTSTSQNPSVVYNTAGTYDVTLEVSDGTNTNTTLKSDYITVVAPVGQASTPVGMDTVCNGDVTDYTTTAVTGADTYQWMVEPADAGSITGTGTSGTFTASSSWTGSFTIKVRAQNLCGDGPWSNILACEVVASPAVFWLTGEGEYCEGSAGAELILDGSETGFDYELYIDDIATAIVEPGTGSPINFGFHTDEGVYSVLGFTGSCSQEMLGQIWVHMVNMPGQAATPQGPESVCNDTTSIYTTTGATEASNYIWTLNPASAGVLAPNMLEASVDWNDDFIGSAYLKVQGENGCGAGAVSDSIEILVNDTPDPTISGLTLVCEDDLIDYQTMDNLGSNYYWEVNGGTIQNGAGTHLITILWGDPGMGYVTVTEENEHGCTTTTEPYEVTIDDCTGIDEITIKDFNIYPNPVKNTLNISTIKNLNIQEVTIYNILGTEVIKLENNSLSTNLSVNTSDLKNGLYFILIKTSNQISTYKFEKVH